MFKPWRDMTPDELRASHVSNTWHHQHPLNEDDEDTFRRALIWIERIAAERSINLEETTNASSS